MSYFEIKKAKNRQCARKPHSDINKAPDAEKQFADVNAAYEIPLIHDLIKAAYNFMTLSRPPYHAFGCALTKIHELIKLPE